MLPTDNNREQIANVKLSNPLHKCFEMNINDFFRLIKFQLSKHILGYRHAKICYFFYFAI